jgi:hypothetical protein
MSWKRHEPSEQAARSAVSSISAYEIEGAGRGRERLSCRSSGEWLPWASVSQDIVEDCDELAGYGNEGEDLRFPDGDEFTAELFELRIVACATMAPMNKELRTLLRLPPIKLLPRHCQDWRVHGARPARARSVDDRANRALGVRRSRCGRWSFQRPAPTPAVSPSRLRRAADPDG